MGAKIMDHIINNPGKKMVMFISSYSIAETVYKFISGRIGDDKIGFYHGKEEIIKNGNTHYI